LIQVDEFGRFAHVTFWVAGKGFAHQIGIEQRLVQLAYCGQRQSTHDREQLDTVRRTGEEAVGRDGKPSAVAACQEACEPLAGGNVPDANDAVGMSRNDPAVVAWVCGR